jgi:type VI secretion system protein VasG
VTARCTEVETGARNIDFILKGTVLPLLSNSLLESMAKNTNPTTAKLDVDAVGEFVATFS